MSSFPTPPPSTTPILNPEPPYIQKKEVDLMLYTVTTVTNILPIPPPTKKFSTSSSTAKSSAI